MPTPKVNSWLGWPIFTVNRRPRCPREEEEEGNDEEEEEEDDDFEWLSCSTLPFWRLMPKGEWSYLFMCLWNNELNFIVFEFGTWVVITLNFVCVRLCELEKFGCVFVMVYSAFYLLRTLYARLKNCVKSVFSLLCWSPECPEIFPEFPAFPDSPDLARRLRTSQH
jgi:hypothetical protein